MLRKLEPWIIFLASLALFLYGIFGRELFSFETHAAVFAQEMLTNGPSVFPTTYNNPYPSTVSGLALLNTFCAFLFGRYSTLAAVFPSAIASALTLVLVYRIALPINREWGRMAVLIALFTYQFFDLARSLSPEPFMMLACVWLFQLLIEQRNFYMLMLPLLLGFCMDGPAGFMPPFLFGTAFYVGHQEWGNLKTFLRQAGILFLALLLILLVAAQHQAGSHFAKAVFLNQVVYPFLPTKSFSLTDCITDTLSTFAVGIELAILGVIAFMTLKKTSRPFPIEFIYTSLLFMLVMLIGIYLTGGHKIRYALPITPFVALLGASLWIIDNSLAKIFRKLFAILCLAFPFILILLSFATIVVCHLKNVEANAHYISVFCTLFLFALASTYILFHHPIGYAERNPKKVICIGLASFFAVMIFVVKPIELSLERIKPFVTHVMQNLPAHGTITFFKEKPDEEPILFLSGLRESIPIYFSETLTNKQTLYITMTETFDHLTPEEKQNVQVVLQEKLGHKEMVVFKIPPNAPPSE